MIKGHIIKDLLGVAATILALGTFLAILSPYQSGRFGVPGVWFYWVGLMCLGWASNVIIQLVTGRFRARWHPLPYHALSSCLTSIPVAAGVLAIQAWIDQSVPLADWPLVFGFVWVISAGVTTVAWLMDRRTAVAEAPGIGRALLDKLPPRLQRASLLALQAEDHYLRVHTGAGDAMILMRLSDAMAAVEALDGRQTHRSWWVARGAVDSVSRGDGRATLTLSNGVLVPVSRTHAPGLRESGWY